LGAGPQPITTRDALDGIYWVAQVAEHIHVAADNPGTYPKPVGQLLAGPGALDLQQR
jgi:hypothetical protein